MSEFKDAERNEEYFKATILYNNNNAIIILS